MAKKNFSPNVIYLDAFANNVVFSGCIFRGGRRYSNANIIGILGGINHTIRENRFTNCNVAVKLLDKSAHWNKMNGQVPKRLRVTQNDFHSTKNVKKYRLKRKMLVSGHFFAEGVPGLIEKAKATDCEFEKPTLSNIGSKD